MRLTLRYYQYFGPEFVGRTLFSAEAWDRLRLGSGGRHYQMTRVRERWVRDCDQHEQAIEGAKRILEIARSIECTAIFSVGVGRACLEYHLKRLRPDLPLTCTEYSRSTLESLSVVFPECDDISFFDITSTSWPLLSGKPLYLLYRVDTGLGDEEWRHVFARMAESGIDHVMIVATGFATARAVIRELARRCVCRILGRSLTLAGYIRSKATFQTLWSPYYDLVSAHNVGGLTGFYCVRAERRPVPVPVGLRIGELETRSP